MNRRIWPGVIAGVLAALVLLTVGFGAYRAGQDNPDDDAVEVVSAQIEPGEEGEGAETVRVVDDHDRSRPPFGFFLFPLLVIVLIAVLVWGRRWGGGWHRPYGPPFGPYGPDARSHWFDEWHRRAHEEGGVDRPAAPAGDTPSDEPSPGPSSPAGGSA